MTETSKTVEEIYGEMRALFQQETGISLRETSEMAVRFYAVATQIYGLYVQNRWTLAQCFPQTAAGAYLDYHAALRGLERKQAGKAEGLLRFSVEAPGGTNLSIPAGTVCMTAGLVAFETTTEAVLTAGSSWVDVPARAVEPGAGGNGSAGSVRAMSVPPLGISGCTNPAAFTGGTEEEGDEALRSRILETYLRMPNGANAAFYEREVLSVPQVAAVNVVGRARGRGTVDVILAGAAGDLPGQVIQEALEHLNQKREIAVDLTVRNPTNTSVGVQVKIAAEDGAGFPTVKAAVEQKLGAYFDGRLLGKPILRAKLGELIFSVPGVSNYRIVQPENDLPAVPGQLPRLGSLTVEVLP